MYRNLALLTAISFSTASAMAVTVTTTGDDGFGASSLNSAGTWSDGLAPSAGNDYVIGATHRLRTPASAGSFVFAGDSLTVSDGDPVASLNGLAYKGTGNTGIITINDLRLDNGLVNHINGVNDLFQLDGNMTVVSDSRIYPKQGTIDLLAAVHGSATLTNSGADGAGRILNILSSANTFTGNFINEGNTVLADDANLNFVIGASGVNNSVTGTGGQMDFNGDFVLDLTGAGTTLGDSWTLASAANQVFGSTFTVAGFIESGDKWNGSANGVDYAFDESTGVLTVVPEPSSLAMLGLGGLLIARRRRG